MKLGCRGERGVGGSAGRWRPNLRSERLQQTRQTNPVRKYAQHDCALHAECVLITATASLYTCCLLHLLPRPLRPASHAPPPWPSANCPSFKPHPLYPCVARPGPDPVPAPMPMRRTCSFRLGPRTSVASRIGMPLPLVLPPCATQHHSPVSALTHHSENRLIESTSKISA